MPNQTLCYPCLTRSTHTLVILRANRYRCPVCGAGGVVETVTLKRAMFSQRALVGFVLGGGGLHCTEYVSKGVNYESV